MNVFAIAARDSVASLAPPLAAVFVVSMGFGLVLPVLPFVLALALDVGASRATISWHTGLLTGTYMLALFLFAPFWGYVSDRVGRRTVILIGLAGNHDPHCGTHDRRHGDGPAAFDVCHSVHLPATAAAPSQRGTEKGGDKFIDAYEQVQSTN